MRRARRKPLAKFKAAFRLGYLYDYSPVVDKSVGPLFPDANRHSFTVGMSKSMAGAEFSLFYEAMKFVDRDVAVAENGIKGTNGLYEQFRAPLIGMSMRLTKGGSQVEIPDDKCR